MPERVEPGEEPDVRPGRWVAEPAGRRRTGRRGGSRSARGPCGSEPAAEQELTLAGTLAHGADGATWLAWGNRADWAADQRAEDGRCLVFDSEPLAQRTEILGVPELVVTRRAERPDRAARRTPLRRRARWLVGARHARRPQPDPPWRP